MKCGTTSLWEHLNGHPEVFFPELKEPGFFLSSAPDPKLTLKMAWHVCVGNQEKYLDLFRNVDGHSAIGEATSVYLWDEHAAEKIHEVCPNARIIIILRDPVTRAESHYLMNLRTGADTESEFATAIENDRVDRGIGYFGRHMYVEMGLYYHQVKRYFDVFGRDQVLVLLTEELVKSPERTLLSVTQHLGIKALAWDSRGVNEARNPFKMPRLRRTYWLAAWACRWMRRWKLLPRPIDNWLATSSLLYKREKPKVDSMLRLRLQEIYEPDIARLEELLGRQLPELRKTWVYETQLV